MTILALGLLGIVAMPQQVIIKKHSPQKVDTEARIEIWNKSLKQLSIQLGGRIVFEVDLKLNPPTIGSNQLGEDDLWLVAAASRTEYEKIAEIVGFFRQPPTASQLAQRQEALLNWLQTLTKPITPGQVKIDSKNLPEDIKETFYSEILRSRPDLLGAALQGTNKQAIHISMYPRITYIDPANGSRKTIPLLSEIPRIEPPKPVVAKARRQNGVAISSPLDFGEGSCLTLGEFAKRATSAFNRPFVLDSRVSDRIVFASGQMSLNSCRTVLKHLTTVVPVTEKFDANSHAETKKELISQIVSSLFKAHKIGGLNAEDFTNGKQLLASEIAERFPNIADYLKRVGLPSNAVVRLSTGLEISTNMGGTGRSLGSVRSDSGHSIPVSMSPITSIVITP